MSELIWIRARHVKFLENFKFYILQEIWKPILHFTRACKKIKFYILQITRVCKNQFLQITFYRILQDFTNYILQDFTFYKKNAIDYSTLFIFNFQSLEFSTLSMRKPELLPLISWFEYRDRPGSGSKISHSKVHSFLLIWVEIKPYVSICTAALNLIKFNLLKSFEKGWRLTCQSKALIEATKIKKYSPVHVTFSVKTYPEISTSKHANRHF